MDKRLSEDIYAKKLLCKKESRFCHKYLFAYIEKKETIITNYITVITPKQEY